MATLAVETIVDTGLAATYNAAAAGGDTFVNDGSGRQFLHVKNADAGVARTITVTPVVATTEKPGFSTLTQPVFAVVVPLSGERFIGPFPLTAFDDPAITYDDESDVTIAVVKI